MIRRIKLLSVLVILWLLTVFPALADTEVDFHVPNHQEWKIIKEIFLHSINKNSFEKRENGDYSEIDDIEVAEVNLDRSKLGEIAIMFTSIPQGTAGPSFEIWKSKNGKWINILSDNLEFGGPFYITPKTVNGFSILRFHDDPDDPIYKGIMYRIYDGKEYECPKCSE